MERRGWHSLLLIETLVNKCSNDAELWEALSKAINALWASNDVQEADAVFWDTSRLEHLNSHRRRATSSEHWVQEQNPAVGNILWQLVVEEFWHACFLVSLDEDLADAHGAAAVAQSLLHGLSCSHNRDTADLSLKLNTRILASNWCGNLMLNNWQVVQAFLNQQANDSVRVEDEIGPLSVLVSDHTGDQ